MTNELALHLKDPTELFVFDPATYDPLAPDELGQSGIEYLLAIGCRLPAVCRLSPVACRLCTNKIRNERR